MPLVFTIVCAIGIVYFHSSLILASAVITLFLMIVIPVVVHEDWTHGNIIPKNRWIRYFFDTLAHLTIVLPFQRVVSPRLVWCYLHRWHHKIWKTPGDLSQSYVDNNHWAIVLFTSKFRKPAPPIFASDQDFENEKQKYRKPLDNVSLFIEDHFQSIILVFHACCLLLLGVELYFYLILLPTWASVRLIIWFGDVLPHRNKKTKSDENDLGLFWLGSAAAYHISHHYHQNDLTFGKGWKKYCDISFYVVKIFYNLNPKSKIRSV